MGLDPAVATVLDDVVRATSKTTGRDFFRALVGSVASSLEVRHCMVTECLDFPPTRVRSLAFWAGGGLMDAFEYSVLATPCEAVLAGERRCYGEDIQNLFPEDDDLKTLEAESYAATPLFGSDGRVIGHLLVMDNKAFGTGIPNMSLLDLFAERAAAELERTQSLALLRSSQTRLRQVIDLVPHFIFAKDRQGRFTLANTAVADAYGAKAEALIGKTDADFNASEEEVRDFRRDDLEVIDQGQTKYIAEERITDARGQQRLLQTTKIPFTSPDEDQPSVLGVSIDITHQRQLEQQQKALQEQVLHAQKMESLGVLAGGLAHDFNNLLTSIMGNLDLAMESMDPSSEALEHLREVGLAAGHSAELAGQMLAYSGKGSFVFGEIDLNHMIREMSDLLLRSVSKKARVELDLAPDLAVMVGDGSQLRQVVMNLIINASDSLENGQGTIRLRTDTRAIDQDYLDSTFLPDAALPGTFAVLEVEDDGCGMDGETLERLFDPFFTTKATGRGLGLAALLGIVRSHSGTVRVESQPGRGTTFTVLFGLDPATSDTGSPTRAETDAAAPAGSTAQSTRTQSTRTQASKAQATRTQSSKAQASKAQSQAQPASAAARGRATILLADDEETVLQVTRLLLERMGMRVFSAADGEEAVRIFEQHGPEIDAAILDITMPKLDGIETLRELRKLRPEVKVLLASGYSEQIADETSEGGEPCGFLKKPYRAAELKRELEKVLGQDRASVAGG